MEAIAISEIQSSALSDIIISLRHFIVSFYLLITALIKATFAFSKFVFLAVKYSSPYTKPLFDTVATLGVYLWVRINELTWKGKVISSIGCGLLLSIFYGWKSGFFRRMGRYLRRLYRHTSKTLHKNWIQIKELSLSVLHITTEILTVTLPALTVVLPLRLYLARNVFRRVFTLSTLITSLWFSLKSVMEFYRHDFPTETNPSLSLEQRTVSGRRRHSLLGNIKLNVETPKRKTIGVFGKSTSTASYNASFNDNVQDDNESRPLDSSIHSNGHDFNILGVTVWLDYWIVASVFDFLITIPIILSRLFIRSGYSTPIKFVMFGHIEEATFNHSSYLTSSPIFTFNLFLPQYSHLPFSWKSLVANSYLSSLTLTYDLTYSILLMFVISHKHRYLVLARRTLVGIVDTCISTLTGLQLIPSVVPTIHGSALRSAQTPKGIIPQIWVFIKPYLPSTILLVFDLLAHVPQIFLLMLPAFLLRPAVFIVSLVYPMIGSLRSLENSIYSKQVYWLIYYSFFSLYEILIMRWLRTTLVWSWLPFRFHLELVFITILQLLCLSPQWIIQLLFVKVVSTLKSSSATNQPSSVIIKEEIETDNTPTASALSDSVITHHHRISSSTESTSSNILSTEISLHQNDDSQKYLQSKKSNRSSSNSRSKETARKMIFVTETELQSENSVVRSGSEKLKTRARSKSNKARDDSASRHKTSSGKRETISSDERRRYPTRSSRTK